MVCNRNLWEYLSGMGEAFIGYKVSLTGRLMDIFILLV